MRLKTSFLSIALLALAVSASADTLKLKNGQVLEGYFVGGNSNGVTFIDTSGVSKTYPLDEIASMSYGAVTPGAAAAPQQPAPPQKIEVPVGTILFVTMSDTLDSSSAFAGERFTGTLAMDLAALGSVVAKKGTVVYGDVVDVDSAHRLRGRSELKIQLTQIVIQGNPVPIVTNVFDTEGKSSGRRTFRRLLGGAGLGAAFGAIGGNAGMGAAIGLAGGTLLSVVQRGDQVQIPAEGQVQFRLQQSVSLPVVH